MYRRAGPPSQHKNKAAQKKKRKTGWGGGWGRKKRGKRHSESRADGQRLGYLFLRMKLAATAKLWNIFSNQEIKLSVYNENNTIPTQQRTLAKGRKLIFLHFNILLIKKYPHYDF